MLPKRYKDCFGQYFIDNSLQLWIVVCKYNRDRNRAYHAQLINLSLAIEQEVKATDCIPEHWHRVNIKVEPEEP